MDERPADDPVRANSPEAQGDPPSASGRVSPGPPPPAANQGRDEPVPGARDVAAAPDTVGNGDPQSPHALDAAPTAPGTSPQSIDPGTASPGNAQGVSAPATDPAPGTSQQSDIAEGVRPSPGEVPGRSGGRGTPS